jgi:class 3 adenylate cyclase
MLSSLFNKFDVACTENSVYKLYSIGDSYVVLGVLDAISGIREEEAFNVVNLAMQMLEIVNLLKKNIQYPDINLRIGIHTGNIIGGIVGTDIVKYDIYGSDVAIAKKME